MNNFSAAFRSLIIFAVCVVLAIWLGYLLANPLTYSSLAIYGFVAFILIFPIFLRWHFQLMLLSWNLAAVFFFLPGRPVVCVPIIVLSLGISLLQRMISKEHHFIRVPQITFPLLCLLAVIAGTAKMTGVGIRSFGGEVYGGHKYVYLVVGLLGYFALSAQKTPPKRRNLYLALFFLGGLTAIIGDTVPLVLTAFVPIVNIVMFIIFAFGKWPIQEQLEAARLDGTRTMSLLVFTYMLARFGIRGIFLSGRPLRALMFLSFFTLGLFGGFRGYILGCGLVFALQFFLEGLHRTKMMAVLTAPDSFGVASAL